MALALGLLGISGCKQKRGFSPWGMPLRIVPTAVDIHRFFRCHYAPPLRYTIRPSQIVAITRPTIPAPSNGVFFDFDRDRFASKLHSAAGSNTTTSAKLPTFSVPRFSSETIRAGCALINSITRETVIP